MEMCDMDKSKCKMMMGSMQEHPKGMESMKDMGMCNMKVKYVLEGMSCGGCLNNVKHVLLKVPEVTEAVVQLNQPSAVITMNKFINVDESQAQLTRSGHYTIKETFDN